MKYRLNELKDGLMFAIGVIQCIIYSASVGVTWFIYSNKPMAIVIAASLTVAHLLIIGRNWFSNKLDEVVEAMAKTEEELTSATEQVRKYRRTHGEIS